MLIWRIAKDNFLTSLVFNIANIWLLGQISSSPFSVSLEANLKSNLIFELNITTSAIFRHNFRKSSRSIHLYFKRDLYIFKERSCRNLCSLILERETLFRKTVIRFQVRPAIQWCRYPIGMEMPSEVCYFRLLPAFPLAVLSLAQPQSHGPPRT